ncbi:hypothetical protein E2C01_059558 [Portunus trituberculatus]|uniref:Uncharacterized protein n=1 Tax=Portunus trituberculatus TaxID=210409 RepID=A0A5B7H9D6_PORTR|nr:hypothetical protein [Portunus trituberculatus]
MTARCCSQFLSTPTLRPSIFLSLHHQQTVSCHLLDQMYVSTSLPLLTPADLHRPDVTGIAYTCGGPTVYSPYTWLGTKVTVRRPTPALSLPKNNAHKGESPPTPPTRTLPPSPSPSSSLPPSPLH